MVQQTKEAGTVTAEAHVAAISSLKNNLSNANSDYKGIVKEANKIIEKYKLTTDEVHSAVILAIESQLMQGNRERAPKLAADFDLSEAEKHAVALIAYGSGRSGIFHDVDETAAWIAKEFGLGEKRIHTSATKALQNWLSGYNIDHETLAEADRMIKYYDLTKEEVLSAASAALKEVVKHEYGKYNARDIREHFKVPK
jgi:hypothetical protein